MSKQYQMVTDRIVAMLEAGTRPWAQGWTGAKGCGRPLRSDGTPYRGMNVLNLWAAAMERGFGSAYWLTYKKAAELGGQVKKGAKAECAFYASSSTRKAEVEGDKDRTFAFLKAYSVFNADEIEGLAPHFYGRATDAVVLDETARVAEADAFLTNTKAVIHHGGGRAYYRPGTDAIHLPDFGAFQDAATYYGTALHELVHWTGAPTRLDRTKGEVFGDPKYAFEELIAELGAAYVLADLGLACEPREDHASYIAGWIRKLKEDERAIFRAAAHAERACGLLHKLQGGDEAEAEPDALAA